MKKTIKLLTLLLALMMCFTVLFTSCSQNDDTPDETPSEGNDPQQKYNSALALIGEGKYEEAYQLLKELGDYADAQKELKKFHYVPTKYIEKEIYSDEPDQEYGYTITITYNEKSLPVKVIQKENEGDEAIVEVVFNDIGLPTKTTRTYDGDSQTVEYTYDGTLREPIKMVMTYSDSSDFMFTVDFTYDANGNLVKQITKSNDTILQTYEATYDSKGNLTTEIQTDSAGSQYTTEYVYDTNGNLTKKSENHYDRFERITEYVYDANGNLTKETRKQKDSNPPSIASITTFEYTYDANGNLTKEVETRTNEGETAFFEDQDITEYTYDADGKLIKEKHSNSYGIDNTDYTYDNNGNLIKKICISEDNDKEIYEAEYKLVYIPFDFSDEEIQELFFGSSIFV